MQGTILRVANKVLYNLNITGKNLTQMSITITTVLNNIFTCNHIGQISIPLYSNPQLPLCKGFTPSVYEVSPFDGLMLVNSRDT